MRRSGFLVNLDSIVGQSQDAKEYASTFTFVGAGPMQRDIIFFAMTPILHGSPYCLMHKMIIVLNGLLHDLDSGKNT